MNLRERLSKIAEAAIKEGVESSKDIISDNVVPSFEDMGMANVAPGEFAQGEITDKENLVNKGDMSNDTDFNKEDACPVEKALDAAEDMLSDLVDISAPKADATLKIVKTTSCDEHGLDCTCPECEHKHHHHHHGPFGESTLNEDEPLYMQNPQLVELYNKWKGQLSDPSLTLATMPGKPNPIVIKDMIDDGIDPRTATVDDYVCHEINDVADRFDHMPKAWNSMIDALVAAAKESPEVRLNADNSEWLPELKLAEQPVNYGESIMGKIITKALGGKSCEEYLSEAVQMKESEYAGPRDWNPDQRINAFDVLNALKQEIGDGSEGIHVVKDLDARQDPIYRVTQIDKEKLPKTLTVETITLKYEDGAYRPQGPSKEAPLTR